MTYTHPASLFDNREALARDGETEQTESRRMSAVSKRLEDEATALLSQHGDDANGKPLCFDSEGELVASEDLMDQGKQVRENRNAPRAEFVSDVAFHDGARLHIDPATSIDSKRQHRVALQRYYASLTKPCEDDACRYARIDAGLKLLEDAQSDFELDVIVSAIRRDCKILGIGTPAQLAVVMGCSTSTVYVRMKDATLDAAIVAIAIEREQTIAEARQSRRLKLDIRLATKGTVFDSPAWHREIERVYSSLRYEFVTALSRETTLSRLDGQKGADRALKMIPHSRLKLLAELRLLTPEICEMLGRMSEGDRDKWIAERDAEDLAELCGDVNQRRKASGRYGSRSYEKRIKAYLVAKGRSPAGPVLPKPNAPTKPKRKAKARTTLKKAA